MRRDLFICLLLAGITLAIYWPARNFDLYRVDDPLFLTETPEIQSGLNGHSVFWAMTGVVAVNWHPVTNLSFVLGHQFWGTNPGAEHLVNVVIHALNAALLFLVLQQMTRSPWRSAAVAALFAWHPLRVESVAWIAERKDVLSVFFFFLTLWAWTCCVEKSKIQSPKSKVWYGLALVFFALGLMSKAMLVTLPFVLLLLDVWPLQRWSRVEGRRSSKTAVSALGSLILEKWPFLVLAATVSVITFMVQHSGAATMSLKMLGSGIRLENVIVSYLRYLAWTFWPANLAPYYSFPSTAIFISRCGPIGRLEPPRCFWPVFQHCVWSRLIAGLIWRLAGSGIW